MTKYRNVRFLQADPAGLRHGLTVGRGKRERTNFMFKIQVWSKKNAREGAGGMIDDVSYNINRNVEC